MIWTVYFLIGCLKTTFHDITLSYDPLNLTSPYHFIFWNSSSSFPLNSLIKFLTVFFLFLVFLLNNFTNQSLLVEFQKGLNLINESLLDICIFCYNKKDSFVCNELVICWIKSSVTFLQQKAHHNLFLHQSSFDIFYRFI